MQNKALLIEPNNKGLEKPYLQFRCQRSCSPKLGQGIRSRPFEAPVNNLHRSRLPLLWEKNVMRLNGVQLVGQLVDLLDL
jgi:hypothetical protein